MRVEIAPTVTAENAHTYRDQLERAMEFADRIHIDFADGRLAPTRLLTPSQAWSPEGYKVDFHVMYENPASELERLIALSPGLIVLHAEAQGDIIGLIKQINSSGIRAGIALLQNSQPEEYANEIEEAEHALIFGGNLGYHGGQADLSMLKKVDRIKQINPQIELAWDGGANKDNIAQIVNAGIAVINVGSYVQKAEDPKAAYAILESVVN